MSIYYIVLFLMAIMAAIGIYTGTYIAEIFNGILAMLFGLMILSDQLTGLPTAFNLNLMFGVFVSLYGLYFIYAGSSHAIDEYKETKNGD